MDDWIYYILLILSIVLLRIALIPVLSWLAERERRWRWRRRRRNGEPEDEEANNNNNNNNRSRSNRGRSAADLPPSFSEVFSNEPPPPPTLAPPPTDPPPPDPECHFGYPQFTVGEEEEEERPPPSYNVALKLTEVEERATQMQRY